MVAHESVGTPVEVPQQRHRGLLSKAIYDSYRGLGQKASLARRHATVFTLSLKWYAIGNTRPTFVLPT